MIRLAKRGELCHRFERPHRRESIMQSRRQFARTMLAAPAALALGAPNSRFGGVQIGLISYSFRMLPADRILQATVDAGLSEIELMSNHAEALLGAPAI